MDALRLLAGDPQTFADKIWGSRVHVHERDPHDLTVLLSLADVDTLLLSSGIRTPAVRLVKQGTVLPASAFTRSATLAGESLSGLVDARKVLAEYAAGATVVLQGLHRYWPPLTRLVRDLELSLGHPCQANAYLTPPGAQGFARHSDTHDVFVFQTHGQKLWEITEDGEERELRLVPGTCVYLPAGTPHAARSESDASLHVTVGINQLTWRSLLTDLATELLADPSYDEPLPAGYLADPEALATRLAERLSTYAACLDRLDPLEVAKRRAERFLTGRPSVLAGGLLDLTRADELGPTTTLRRRATAACRVVSDGDRVRLLLGDRELRMPARLEPAVAYVAEHDELTPADLPGLTASDALVLVRRLVREGLLGIVG
jgi:lysine-specific demethylase/histidyl-hydroxylase NO66